MTLTLDEIRALPKVALHDHLDGGLRPQTVLELAAEAGHELPAQDAEALGDWFYEAADSGSLVRYLETFDHTVAVMQTADALRRVAREFVLDQAADGVVYAEARWAPEQHLRQGLSPEQAVRAVADGLAEGEAEVAAQGRTVVARQIVTGMRHADRSAEIARLAVAHRDSVCGYDIAGAEDGFPPSRHLEAFDVLKRASARWTVHAGEAAGLDSLWEAVHLAGAQRLGHGVRIVEDVTLAEDGTRHLGPLAAFVRDTGIPLEVCPSSNLQTGIASTIEEHPVGLLVDLGFAVTVSCDNRLMSRTTLSRELALCCEAFDWDLEQLEVLQLTALDHAFLPLPDRARLLEQVVLPGFAG
ncbi:adenosine deaminase [Auraticoccus sp. F435]|uniref:adenosine deaminase n=1 Tax=Auraticoccus cholistanensis TaxID=2656650 RepID=A0A6A9UXS3_9ACTN|nr:adenosine deaminase [Auraticoccus cholistanensis]MVA76414.1 adenosine deaminase [Auraticoccus cholistanensis]